MNSKREQELRTAVANINLDLEQFLKAIDLLDRQALRQHVKEAVELGKHVQLTNFIRDKFMNQLDRFEERTEQIPKSLMANQNLLIMILKAQQRKNTEEDEE